MYNQKLDNTAVKLFTSSETASSSVLPVAVVVPTRSDKHEIGVNFLRVAVLCDDDGRQLRRSLSDFASSTCECYGKASYSSCSSNRCLTSRLTGCQYMMACRSRCQLGVSPHLDVDEPHKNAPTIQHSLTHSFTLSLCRCFESSCIILGTVLRRRHCCGGTVRVRHRCRPPILHVLPPRHCREWQRSERTRGRAGARAREPEACFRLQARGGYCSLCHLPSFQVYCEELGGT